MRNSAGPILKIPHFLSALVGSVRRGSIVRAVLAAAGAAVMIHSFYFAWQYCTVTPYWDFWNWLTDFQSYVSGHYSLHDLVKPHNEHRIVSTRIVLFVDALFFNMNGHFAVLVNCALLAVIGAMLGCLSAQPNGGLAASVITALPVAGLMASVCQWQNLILPFQVQHAFLGAFLVSAFLCCIMATEVDSSRTRSSAYACLGALSFAGATFSMAGGLLAAPWLLLVLWLRRFPRLPSSIFIAITAASISLFLNGYHPDSSRPMVVGNIWNKLLTLIEFAAGFLGSPLYPFGVLPFAAGFIGLSLFAVVFYFVLRWAIVRDSAVPAQIVALTGIAGSIVGMAAAAAVSRAGAGLPEALQPRYATIALIFWASLIPLLFRIFSLACCEGRPGLNRGASILQAAVYLCLLSVLNSASRYAHDARQFAGLMRSQAESIRENVFVPSLFDTMFYGSVNEAGSRLAFLRAHHLSVFGPRFITPQPATAQLAAQYRTRVLPDCTGQIDLSYRLDQTRFIVRGWLGFAPAKMAADWVAFLTASGQPVAVVAAVEDRGAIRVNHVKFHNIKGIFAGLRDQQSTSDPLANLRAVGLFKGRPDLECQLRDPLTFGPFRVQTIKSIVTPTPVAFQLSTGVSGFAINGTTRMAPLTAPFANEPLFASGAAGDQATGSIAFAITPPPNTDIVMPFATGPSVRGQSLEASFPDGTRARLEVPGDTGDLQWRVSTLSFQDIAKHGGSVTIIAKDAGTGWGQWMAVGAPMATVLNPDWAKLY